MVWTEVTDGQISPDPGAVWTGARFKPDLTNSVCAEECPQWGFELLLLLSTNANQMCAFTLKWSTKHNLPDSVLLRKSQIWRPSARFMVCSFTAQQSTDESSLRMTWRLHKSHWFDDFHKSWRAFGRPRGSTKLLFYFNAAFNQPVWATWSWRELRQKKLVYFYTTSWPHVSGFVAVSAGCF